MRALRYASLLLVASCGGFLPFFGDDSDDSPPPPPPSPVVVVDEGGGADGSSVVDAAIDFFVRDAAIERVDDPDGSRPSTDGAPGCRPSKTCAMMYDECCSQMPGTGCIAACTGVCCL